MKKLYDNISMFFAFVAIGILLYILMLPVLQAKGWMTHAQWQSIPFGAIFLSRESQKNLMLYEPNPLRRIPSLGGGLDLEGVAQSLTPKALGIQKISLWVLSLPFVLVAAVILTIFIFIGVLITDSLENFIEEREKKIA